VKKMSIMSVENVTHYYGDKLILQNIEFRLLNKERVGLIGPNGSGKSTLLKILSGDLLPDDGFIELQPNIHIGYLEQQMDLKAGMSIREYLKTAFQDLFDLEQEMLQLAITMSDKEDVDLVRSLNRFAQIQEILEHREFYFIDAKVDEVALGLGIHLLGMDKDVAQLSGGQRTKILLAKLLLKEPDVLLLDEPTNYLDVEHINWLKDYLRNYKNSFILISHDTEFINEVVNVIYHLEHKTITRYLGNYQKFVELFEFRKQQIYLAYNRQQEEIQKLESYIQKNKVRASTSKQAKSREKKLEKMDRIDKPEPAPKPRFSFKPSVRPGGLIMETLELEVGYDTALLPPFSVQLKRGEKVAVFGHNGIGKSTMLKTIIGELNPFKGVVHFGQNIRPAYFAQEWAATASYTPLEYIWSLNETLTQKEVRQALARSGLKTEHIFQPMNQLSGGEQTKVRLCQLMLENSNWLILDEPTNHLDTQSKEVLSNALKNYEGTILVVSHEPEFYQQWVTKIWDLEQWRTN
jgi:ATPase subunit of ABC transporter with duplicated ATPase domains